MKYTLSAMLLALPLLLNACAARVNPQHSIRVYEKTTAAQMPQAVQHAFLNSGFLIQEAKTTETTTTKIKDGKKISITAYTYGPAKRMQPGRDCMKLGTVKWTSMPAESIQIVELQVLNVTCWHSLNKMNLAPDTEKATYDSYYEALTQQLGRAPVGVRAP